MNICLNFMKYRIKYSLINSGTIEEQAHMIVFMDKQQYMSIIKDLHRKLNNINYCLHLKRKRISKRPEI